MAYADYTRVLEEIEFPPKKASLKLALLVFLNRANDESGLTWVGGRKLRIAAGVGPDQAKNLVGDLVRDGWIVPYGVAKLNRKTGRWSLLTGEGLSTGNGRSRVYRLNASKILATLAEQRAARAAESDTLETPLFAPVKPQSAEMLGGLDYPHDDASGALETPQDRCPKSKRGYSDDELGVMSKQVGGSPVPPELEEFKKTGAGVGARVHERPLTGGVEHPRRSHLWPAFCDLVLTRPDASAWAGGWGEAETDEGALVLVAPSRLHYERLEQAVSRRALRGLGYRAVRIARTVGPDHDRGDDRGGDRGGEAHP